MARCACVFVIKCICFFTCFYYVKCRIEKSVPSINSVSILSKSVRNSSTDIGINYFIRIRGDNLNPRMRIRGTTVTGGRGEECNFVSQVRNTSAFLKAHFFNETVAIYTWSTVNTDFHEPLYLCVGTADVALNSSISAYQGKLIKWIHQGQNVFLIPDKEESAPSGRPHNSRSVLTWCNPLNTITNEKPCNVQ